MKNLSRQGDILIQPVLEIPKEAKKTIDGIIVYGEATGHAHRLEGGDVYKTKEGMMFLKVDKKGRVIHDEHKPIHLKKGKYSVVRQREYLTENMSKIVVD